MRVARKDYRPDIDGMRGFGALIVMMFHLNKEYLPGGVCSLTWFFVYSGYLITRNIVHDLDKNRFSFRYFYLRRARRLFPAHIVVLLLTMLFAGIILTPGDLMELGQSAVAVSLFSGNIFFSTVTGYFDSDVYQKPLLHTWSLSIEEQYYFLWPIVVVFLLRYRNHRSAVTFLVLGMVASLGLASWMYSHNSQAAYYLLPSRMFEFMAGSLMVWIIPYRIKSKFILELMGLVALAGILFPLFLYELDTPYPGIAVIIPVVAVCLLIYTGPQKLSGRVFNNSFFIAGGMISYSLYLVHWPIITIYRYYFVTDNLSLYEQAGLMALAVFSAALIYRYVETPFRYTRNEDNEHKVVSNNSFVIVAILLTAFASVVGAAMYKGDGWGWRVPLEVRNATVHDELAWNRAQRMGTCYFHINDPRAVPTLVANYERCLKPKAGKKNYLLLGASQGGHYHYGLQRVFPEHHFLQATIVNCLPTLNQVKKDRKEQCEPYTMFMFGEYLTKQNGIDAVVLANAWYSSSIKRLPETIDYLKSRGHKVILFGPNVRYREPLPMLIVKHGRMTGLRRYLSSYIAPFVFVSDKAMRALAKEKEVTYVSIVDLTCTGDMCAAFDNGVPLLHDKNHFTKEGSEYIARQIKDKTDVFSITVP